MIQSQGKNVKINSVRPAYKLDTGITFTWYIRLIVNILETQII